MSGNWRILLLLGCAGMLGSGCEAILVAGGAAAGAGTALYLKGDLKVVIEEPMDRVYEASIDGLQRSGVMITSKQKSLAKATIKGRLQDDTPVTVKLKPEQRKTTDVSIRVGIWGDEPASRRILDHITAALWPTGRSS